MRRILKPYKSKLCVCEWLCDSSRNSGGVCDICDFKMLIKVDITLTMSEENWKYCIGQHYATYNIIEKCWTLVTFKLIQHFFLAKLRTTLKIEVMAECFTDKMIQLGVLFELWHGPVGSDMSSSFQVGNRIIVKHMLFYNKGSWNLCQLWPDHGRGHTSFRFCTTDQIVSVLLYIFIVILYFILLLWYYGKH